MGIVGPPSTCLAQFSKFNPMAVCCTWSPGSGPAGAGRLCSGVVVVTSLFGTFQVTPVGVLIQQINQIGFPSRRSIICVSFSEHLNGNGVDTFRSFAHGLGVVLRLPGGDGKRLLQVTMWACNGSQDRLSHTTVPGRMLGQVRSNSSFSYRPNNALLILLQGNQ